jgi:DNA-binding LacI/PurR family transcriptional regulator
VHNTGVDENIMSVQEQIQVEKAPHKHIQLADVFRRRVEKGELQPGDRLPSYAELRAEHGVSQDTLERMYKLLEQDGLVIREHRRGTFVAQLNNGNAPTSHIHIQSASRTKRTATKILACAGMVNSENHPYSARILAGVQDAARAEGYDLLIFRDPSIARWQMVDGLLAIGYNAMETAELRPAALPCVGMLVRDEDIPYVTVDDEAGVHTLTDYLLELGHRRIAYLFSGEEKSQNLRVQGYRRALMEAGIEPQNAWLRSATPDKSFDRTLGFAGYGHREMARWLREDWSTLGCTALLAHNDEFAIGALRALREAGLHVPGDVSVAGFDGTELAKHARPSLTTMAVPLYEIGATGVKLLARRLKKEGSESTQVLAARLKVGGSTAAPNEV